MLARIKICSLAIFFTLFFSGCVGNIWPQKVGDKTVVSSKKIFRTRIMSPSNIAIMLPLKGKGELALTSQAIRNGFLAAYDYFRKQRPNINIRVIDTTNADVSELYRQAVTGGADLIIGPLTKQEVGAITNVNPLPVPTIALNTLDNYTHNFMNNLYQFGLLPLDEAIQVSMKMAQEKLGCVAIIAPRGIWGFKIATAFKNRYELYGGQVIATLNYNSNKGLAEQICNFLSNDAAKLCVPRPHKNKKQKSQDQPMRRQDIDAIFLIATTPEQARQIVPLLKFYYASDLPIYSISTIYSGNYNQDLDQDINDVYFCDMPWVIKNPDYLDANLRDIYKQIVKVPFWVDSFAKYKKFYALGVDAYNLAIGLNELLDTPSGGVSCASGTLYLDNFNHVYRELQWAQMKNGKVEEISYRTIEKNEKN